MATISSVQDFIGELFGRGSKPTSRVVSYRGHPNEAYLLRPSIFRTPGNRENEHILLRELIAAHPEDFTADASALELLVRMQHYSLPTRLLDVTFNPLVALYFACEPAKKRVLVPRTGKRTSVEANGEVITFAVASRRVRYFDSDTVSVLANLARLKASLKTKIDTSLDQGDFNTDLPVRRLLHFIRQEQSGFEPEIVPEHLDQVLLVKPKQNNRRILAQAGAFFLFGLTEELQETNSFGITVERTTVAAGAKADIRRDLDKLGINEKTLFPEIERAASYLAGTVPSGTVVRLLRP